VSFQDRTPLEKSPFQGRSHVLADPSPERSPPQRPSSVSALHPPPLALVRPPPGPDNRATKVTVVRPGAPDANYDASLYKLTGADVQGMLAGERAREKTFADVRWPAKVQPLVATVKFQILIGQTTVNAEAKFQTSETLAALYTYLEKEVFDHVDSFELRFMAKVLPRDPAVTLASQQICGPIMLTVVVSGKATIKK
jgi:hypothetical protein